MKTLGLIGGMSWESTAIYYRLLNEIVRERLGGLHSAKLLLWSFDFAEIAERQHAGDVGEVCRTDGLVPLLAVVGLVGHPQAGLGEVEDVLLR